MSSTSRRCAARATLTRGASTSLRGAMARCASGVLTLDELLALGRAKSWANRRQAGIGLPWRWRNGMLRMAKTLSFKHHHTKLPNLLNLRVDLAIDLQAREPCGFWRVFSASFVAIHDPYDRATPTGANYADLPAQCASALGIVVGATLKIPATALFLKLDPRGCVDPMSLLRAIAEVLETFGVSLRVGINQADDIGLVETSGLFTGALHSVDQLILLVESRTKRLAPTRVG